MRTIRFNVTKLAILLSTFVGVVLFTSLLFYPSNNSVLQVKDCQEDHKIFMQQRNELARMANIISQKAAMLSCEKEDLLNPRQRDVVSVTGGWCEKNTKKIIDTRADFDLTYAMSELLKGKRVGSFGDGPGSYKKIFDQDNKVAAYDAFDGAPYYSEGSDGAVQYLDLTLPQYGLKLYDWVISLEVAEHIDAKYEAVYLSNIVRHAAEGIIISWAYPGQPGIQHINCRTWPYVLTVLDDLGFYLSLSETDKLRKSTGNQYYKINVSVFRRKESVPVDLDML